jgi:RNA polymerase sigma factor (sigma-70 family)
MTDLRDLIDKQYGRLHAFIRSRVPGEEDSWDILQDVFTALTARWNIGDALEDASAWLFRVARNRIADLYRRRSRRDASLEQLLGVDGEGFSGDLSDTLADGPDDLDQRIELRNLLLGVIRNLPPEQREAFVQTELRGRRFADISRETGIPLNTLLARKRYAVLKLRSAISDYEEKRRRE